MTQAILLYLVALASFLVIDLVWLGIIAQRLYAREMGPLLTKSVNWWAAGVFYLVFVAGLCFFVIHPAIEQATPLWHTLGRAAFFGFVTYATYDLTGLAVIE